MLLKPWKINSQRNTHPNNDKRESYEEQTATNHRIFSTFTSRHSPSRQQQPLTHSTPHCSISGSKPTPKIRTMRWTEDFLTWEGSAKVRASMRRKGASRTQLTTTPYSISFGHPNKSRRPVGEPGEPVGTNPMTISTDHFLTAHINITTYHIPKRPQRQQREQIRSSKKRGFRSETARLQR